MSTTAPTKIPSSRLRALNARPARARGEYVLYWMCAARRLEFNFALDRAVEWALHLGRPLVIFEPLRAGYPWASARHHTFVLQGMADNVRAARRGGCTYFAYVEPETGAGRGLLAALSASACVVVTDDFPCFFLPRMVASAARAADVAFEGVDSNGLLPLRTTSELFPTAYAFRRFLQRNLQPHLDSRPRDDPFADGRLPASSALPARATTGWIAHDANGAHASDAAIARTVDALPIDPSVRPAPTRGGSAAAQAVLQRFLRERLAKYAEHRSEPESDVSSGLSPYLHFGHVSTHAIFAHVARHEGWSSADLGSTRSGKREGFWGMGAAAESFLDELVTWRELCFNTCANMTGYDRYASLPAWARATLEKHAADPRQHVYSLAELALSRTHDVLWNAAQSELREQGKIHNYLRMLWGKKILEWTRSPMEALEIMIELNNRYALDGRDPNSYGGITWVLGRYDRPWGPERKVYGTVRYMSSDNTARKFDVDGYIERHPPRSADQARFDRRSGDQARLDFGGLTGSTSAT